MDYCGFRGEEDSVNDLIINDAENDVIPYRNYRSRHEEIKKIGYRYYRAHKSHTIILI